MYIYIYIYIYTIYTYAYVHYIQNTVICLEYSNIMTTENIDAQ